MLKTMPLFLKLYQKGYSSSSPSDLHTFSLCLRNLDTHKSESKAQGQRPQVTEECKSAGQHMGEELSGELDVRRRGSDIIHDTIQLWVQQAQGCLPLSLHYPSA